MRRIEIVAVIVAGLVIGLVLLVQGKADAAQPYGGCDEAWQAPSSEGAQLCRDKGWTVTSQLVVNPRGVVKASRLPDCATAAAPCALLAGLDSGWLDSDYTWHSVWTSGPRGYWRWASRAEQHRFGLLPSNQVQRRHGRVTWFRGPSGETWANVKCIDPDACPDSEHWPEGQAPR